MKKIPFTNEAKLREIEKKYPTPFHLYNESGIRGAAQAIEKAFAWNAGYKEFYAVKACPNPFILRALKEEGCGVDCASVTELMLAEACGFKGEEIMFSSNETLPEDYQLARKLGAIINLDDITHIDFLEQNGGLPEKICMRYNPGGTVHFGASCMGIPEEAKYGMTEDQILEAVRIMKDRGVKQFAVHAFLASNTVEAEYYKGNAEILLRLAVKIHEECDAEMFMVNLSGGVGIDYRPEVKAPNIQLVGDLVGEAFEKIMVPAGLGHVRVVTELGRFMTGPHGMLITKAIHEKHIYREYIGVNACAVDLMRPAMYGAYHHITVMGKENEPCDHVYDVVGSLCENNDKFAIQRALPKIEMGDLLAIHDTGAHGYSMGYNYNGRLKSAEIMLHPDGSFSMIRRAETAKDYFATLDFCGIMEAELNK